VHPWRRRASQARDLAAALVLAVRLLGRMADADLRREYLRRLARAWRRRPEPELLLLYVVKCACHFHYHQLVRRLRAGELRNSF
jgi:uncharacterized membrane-anchored protein